MKARQRRKVRRNEGTVSIDELEAEGKWVFIGLDMAAPGGKVTGWIEAIQEYDGRVLIIQVGVERHGAPLEFYIEKQKGGGGGSKEEKPV